MHFHHLITAIFMLAILYGCGNIRPINELSLPPVSVIEGTVSDIRANGFTLTDYSGHIAVRLRTDQGMLPSIINGEYLTLYGNLLSGSNRLFDTYVLERENGQRIIFTSPTLKILETERQRREDF